MCAPCRAAFSRNGREIAIPPDFDVAWSDARPRAGYRDAVQGGTQIVTRVWRPRWAVAGVLATPCGAVLIARGLVSIASDVLRDPLAALVDFVLVLVGLAGLYAAAASFQNRTRVEIARDVIRWRDAPLRWRARREIAREPGDTITTVSRWPGDPEGKNGPKPVGAFDVFLTRASGERFVLFARIPSERHALAVGALLRESLAPR